MISKSQDAHLEIPQASLWNSRKNAGFSQSTGIANSANNLSLMRKAKRWSNKIVKVMLISPMSAQASTSLPSVVEGWVPTRSSERERSSEKSEDVRKKTSGTPILCPSSPWATNTVILGLQKIQSSLSWKMGETLLGIGINLFYPVISKMLHCS